MNELQCVSPFIHSIISDLPLCKDPLMNVSHSLKTVTGSILKEYINARYNIDECMPPCLKTSFKTQLIMDFGDYKENINWIRIYFNKVCLYSFFNLEINHLEYKIKEMCIRDELH